MLLTEYCVIHIAPKALLERQRNVTYQVDGELRWNRMLFVNLRYPDYNVLRHDIIGLCGVCRHFLLVLFAQRRRVGLDEAQYAFCNGQATERDVKCHLELEHLYGI